MLNDQSIIENLPNELFLRIANGLLNPAERSRLSTCNRRCRAILPSSLKVKIVSSRGDGSLQPEFFVSPTDQPGSVLECADNLLYGRQYYFWTFDYQRGNKVFLGRHTRHGHKIDDSGDLQHIYTVGLRPRHPNQKWEIVGGNQGDVVMYGEDIGLSVGGDNPKPRQPDSNYRCLLSCFRSTKEPSWGVLADSWGENEKLQVLRCQDYVPGEDVAEKDLIIHAIPEVCDEGEYLVHAPQSRKHGKICCDGYHVIVNFHFWIEKGVMHFCAPVLPFSLGIPILDTDAPVVVTSRLANLLEIKSARWGCVIYYMAVAADVSEGKTLDIERFRSRVTDHHDHNVIFDDAKKLVSIEVPGKQVNRQASALARDGDLVWHFILSW